MTAGLLWSLAGLALLDSLNTSTLLVVVVVLLLARRPVLSAWLYLAGAVGSFLLLALGLYLGASGAAAAFDGGALLVRRVALLLVAVLLLVLAGRRLRERPRRALDLPGWFSPATAVVVGVLATLADLPTAFPLFLAVERLTAAGVTRGDGVLALLGYAAVYALPAVVALVVGSLLRERLRSGLEWLRTQVGGGPVPRSVPVALLLTAGAVAAGTVAVVL